LNNKTLKSPIDVYRKWVHLRLYFINHEKLKKENYKPFTARLKQNKVSESKSCGCVNTKNVYEGRTSPYQRNGLVANRNEVRMQDISKTRECFEKNLEFNYTCWNYKHLYIYKWKRFERRIKV